MNPLKLKLIGTITCISLLFSCGDGSAVDNQKVIAEPKALQDEKLEIKSYNRSGDLTEELYQELVSNDVALQKLEDDISDLRTKSKALNEKFQSYNNKSNSYYSSAEYKSSSIQDSILRKKIEGILMSSKKTYSRNTSEINALLEGISKQNMSLSDHHTILKIAITLPLIEKFQANNKPDKKEFKSLIIEQEKIIIKTDSLMNSK